MWQVIETTEYFVKFITKSNYEVYVTDFTRIWYLYLTEEQFLESLQEANPILEMTNAEFLQKGNEMLLIPKNYHSLLISRQDSKLQLSLVKRFPFKLKLKLELNSGSREMFFQQVTQALVQTVDDLKSSQLELRIQLNKKDKEIDEYKCKGVEISARHLKTNKFNDTEHLSKYKTFEDNFGATIPEFLLKKSVELNHDEIPRNEDSISKTIKVKTEPLSQSSEMEVEQQSKLNKMKAEQPSETSVINTGQHSLTSDVKTEQQSQTSIMNTGQHSLTSDVKTEQQSQIRIVKTEQQTQNGAVTESNNIKQEEISFSNRICSPKKKMKRLNL